MVWWMWVKELSQKLNLFLHTFHFLFLYLPYDFPRYAISTVEIMWEKVFEYCSVHKWFHPPAVFL